MNVDTNVLVVIIGGGKLKQFTTHGNLLQTIQLQQDIQFPTGVIQLFSSQFLISHVATLNRLSLLDYKGAVVRSFGGAVGSDLTKMNWPADLPVNKHLRHTCR